MDGILKADNRIGAEFVTISAQQFNALEHAIFGQWVSLFDEMDEQFVFLFQCQECDDVLQLVLAASVLI